MIKQKEKLYVMWTIPFNTIDRRGCCRACTCLGSSSAFLCRKFLFQRRGVSKWNQPWQKLGAELAFQGLQPVAPMSLFPQPEQGWVLCLQRLPVALVPVRHGV